MLSIMRLFRWRNPSKCAVVPPEEEEAINVEVSKAEEVHNNSTDHPINSNNSRISHLNNNKEDISNSNSNGNSILRLTKDLAIEE